MAKQFLCDIDLSNNSISNVATPVNAGDAVNKSYVDTLLASGMRIKGSIDCSTNPNYPAAVTGDAYAVSVAGKIGGVNGQVVEAGDFIIAIADNGGGDEATVGSSWMILQKNIVLGTSAGKFSQSIGDGTTTLFTVTHNLNNAYCTVQLYDTTTGNMVETCIRSVDANNIELSFNAAPAVGQYQVVVQG